METREDEHMTKVSSTSTDIIIQTKEKPSTHTSEQKKRGAVSQVKSEEDKARLEREVVATQRRLEKRSARLEELRTRVSSGTYSIDTMIVAQRIQDSPVMPVIMGKNTPGLPRLPRFPRPRRLP